MFRHSGFGAWTQRDFMICDVFLKIEINKLSTSKSSKLEVKIEIFILKFLLRNSVTIKFKLQSLALAHKEIM